MYKLYIHAGCDNHGCEAIVRTTANIIDEPITLYSRNPELDEKYGIQNICKIEFDERTEVKRGSWKWFLSASQIKVFGKIDKHIKFRYKKFINSIKRDDICLSIGGDNYCYPGTEELAAINRNLKKKGARLVLWGCSVEPSITEQPEVAKDLCSFDLITARESISYNALKRINKKTIFVPDPAFTLKTEMLPLPENWIEGNMIGINASPLILQNGKNVDMVYKAYKVLIKDILEQTDCGIALIPHVVCVNNDDRIVLKQLFDEFKNTKRVVLIENHNCMELKGFIARCRFFIGARTHATIAAYSSCVPTLVLGYSVKSRGIARDLFGTEENYVLPVQSLQHEEDLANAFRWIMEHETEIKHHLTDFLPEYKERCRGIKNILENL